MKESFIHKFGSGVRVTATLDLSKPKNGDKFTVDFVWKGKPTKELVQEYIEWKGRLMQMWADRLKIKILDATMISPTQTIFNTYEPKPK